MLDVPENQCPSPAPCYCTFSLHAHGQALLVAAVLAAVALALVHQALFVIPARVTQVFAHGAFEEAFAAFAAVHSVVFPYKVEELKG